MEIPGSVRGPPGRFASGPAAEGLFTRISPTQPIQGGRSRAASERDPGTTAAAKPAPDHAIFTRTPGRAQRSGVFSAQKKAPRDRAGTLGYGSLRRLAGALLGPFLGLLFGLGRDLAARGCARVDHLEELDLGAAGPDVVHRDRHLVLALVVHHGLAGHLL